MNEETGHSQTTATGQTDSTTWRVQAEAPALRPSAAETLTHATVPLGTVLLVAGLLHLYLVPLCGQYGDYVARIAVDAGIAVILAVSLNFVNGLTGQFSIGHAGFAALGGYVAGMLTYYGSFRIWGDLDLHGGWFGNGEILFAVNCLLGGLVGAFAGYLVGLPTLRLKGDYLAIVTLGFGEIVRVLLTQTAPILSYDEWQEAKLTSFFPPPVGGALGFSDIPKYTNLFWVYLFAGLTMLFALRLKFSSQGRMLISIREDEIAAQAMGVHVTRWKVRAFVISAFFASLAGGLVSHESGVILRPVDAGFARSFEVVIMVVLGGRGSVSGVALAAIILTVLPEALRDFAQYRQIIYALLLIIMMLVRPQGLFGMHEIWDYFPRLRKAT